MRYVIATLLFCLAGIFGLPLSAQTSTSADSTSVTGHDIVKVAMKYIGVPYRSGRMNPKVGFDCSGFTTYVFKKENIQLTRSSRSQFTEGVEVSSCTDLQNRLPVLSLSSMPAAQASASLLRTNLIMPNVT